MNTVCKELDTCQDDRPARRKRFSPQQLQFAASPFPPDVNHIFNYYVLEVNHLWRSHAKRIVRRSRTRTRRRGTRRSGAGGQPKKAVSFSSCPFSSTSSSSCIGVTKVSLIFPPCFANSITSLQEWFQNLNEMYLSLVRVR